MKNTLETDKISYPWALTEKVWLLGNHYFNLFFVKGQNKSALIEVGVSAMVDRVIRQLDSINEAPDYLIVTHPHSDHITGLDGLRKKYPTASVIAGRGSREFISHPRASEMLIAEDRYMSGILAAKGMVSKNRWIKRPPELENCRFVDDGDRIDLGEYFLEFLVLNGHSPGNIGVFLPRGKVLIASDSLGFHYPGRGFMPLFFTGLEEYVKTIDRLASMAPSILGLGHQGPIFKPDISTAFHDSRQMTMNLYKKLSSSTEDVEKISKSLYDRFYKDELTLYSGDNILNCCRLLVKRARETLKIWKG